MKIIDIVILIPIVWGAFRGYGKGFIVELTTLLSLIIAILLGFQLMETAIGYLDKVIDIPQGALPFVAFILVFVSVLFLVSWIAKYLKKIVHYTVLGYLDNFAGAIFGALKFAFIISVMLWLAESTSFLIPASITDDAIIFPIMSEYSPLVIEQMTTIFPLTKDLVHSINELIIF